MQRHKKLQREGHRTAE